MMGLGEGGRKRAAVVWYLVGLPSYKNFVEAIEPEVSRCYKQLRQAQRPLPPPSLPQADEWRSAPDADAERKRLARLVDKQERFVQVKDLLSSGLSPKEIAQRLA